jgi:hypothetical protein
VGEDTYGTWKEFVSRIYNFFKSIRKDNTTEKIAIVTKRHFIKENVQMGNRLAKKCSTLLGSRKHKLKLEVMPPAQLLEGLKKRRQKFKHGRW